uniref:hypothetical protein n=1 Tax=Methylobacterium sp. B34 TaxID=95563 RepID=UPI00034D71CB|nr:hypothetical protein [Methylobacterium sp. B34]
MTADVIAMPYRVAPGHARHLSENLAAMVAAGHDPGPRGAQIRALGLTLETSVRELRAELAQLGFEDGSVPLIETLELMARMARGYGGDGNP